MHIFIFGNLNSGKSHLAQQLSPHLPNYKYLAIDDYRIKYSDGSLEGKQQAVERFVTAVINQDDALVDFSGCGAAAEMLQKKLSKCNGILLVCTRHASDCISAIDTKKYDLIPYPSEYKKQETLEQTIKRLEKEVSFDFLTDQWQAFIWQSYQVPYALEINAVLDLISIEHHITVEQVKLVVLNNPLIHSAIIYGSMGANTVNRLSDLDFFIETTCDPLNIQTYFASAFSTKIVHSDLLENKITLRLKSTLLIELVCGQHLNETALYFRESQIKHASSCVLKGNAETIKLLQHFMSKDQSGSERAKPIAAQLYFLFCSLPKLVANSDTYKYHFHIAIMQHYAIQLEHLLIGNEQHNYLPKYAADTLPVFPWQVFATTATRFNPNQYQQLQCYLIDLYAKLEKKKLIKQSLYFTPANLHLHLIEN